MKYRITIEKIVVKPVKENVWSEHRPPSGGYVDMMLDKEVGEMIFQQVIDSKDESDVDKIIKAVNP